MDSGIVSLNDNLTKAAQGVAPDALVAFDRLGIALKDSTGHVRKATSVLPELADKLQAVKDPTIKLELLTRIFGGSAEQMFRVLDGGSAVLQRNIDLAMKAGVQTDAQIKRSRELQYAEADLTNSISGLSNEIIGSLAPAPALTPMLGDMTRWIQANPEAARGIVEVTGAVAGLVTGLGALRLAVKLSGLAWAARTLAGGVGAVVGGGAVGGGAAVVGAGAFIGAGGIAGGMQVPMVDEYGRVIGNWGGKDESKNLAAVPSLTARPPLGPSGSNAPRGIRNNNPLNLSYVPGQGASGSDGRFGVYPSMDAGINAAERQLLLYQDRDHLNTVRGIVSKWAPPSENNTGSYVNFVAGRLGVSPDSPIDLHDQKTMTTLIGAMGKRETGQEIGIGSGTGASPAPTAVALSGGAKLNINLGGFPPGTTTNMSATGNMWAAPPKVETAMALP
jgi:hypothetical protein